jgi:hypothetical protein
VFNFTAPGSSEFRVPQSLTLWSLVFQLRSHPTIKRPIAASACLTVQIAIMPAIARLAPRLLESSGSTGISGGAIALIVCIGIIPVIVLFWVVAWLLFTYPGGRTCWCTRSKKPTPEPTLPMLETSQESFNEKSGTPLPQKPYATYRTDTAGSNGSRVLKKHQPRGSLQSVYSNGNEAPMQPQPFV